MHKFHNSVEIVVKSGETGKIIHRQENAIADDFLVTSGRIFSNNTLYPFYASYYSPVCFLLPDGANWAGFTWDRTNPWAPYTATLNNQQNTSVDGLAKGLSKNAPNNLTPPSAATNFRWKMFYSWTQLPTDLQLKAIGLTGLQDDAYLANSFGLAGNGVPCNFVPETLVVLPSSILIHGAPPFGSTGTPDILEISYFLSVVGAS